MRIVNIKFYSENDMSCGNCINKIIKKINNFELEEKYTINLVIENYNIEKYYKVDHFKKILKTHTNEKICSILKNSKKKIGQFIEIHKTTFLNLYKEVDPRYKDNFWEIVELYKIYEFIGDEDLKKFLEEEYFYNFELFTYKEIVKKFDIHLCNFLLKNPKNSEFIVEKYFKRKNNIYLPKALNSQKIETLFLSYIQSENPNIKILEQIVLMLNNELKISDKLKLMAKKRLEEENYKLLKKYGVGSIFNISVSWVENQFNGSVYKYENGRLECTLSSDWIKNNLNYNTLLNNFIYIFEFVDSQMRLKLVSKSKEEGYYESLFRLQAPNLYNSFSGAFEQKEVLSNFHILSYNYELDKYNIRLEIIIEWFFEEYLKNEFNIENYVVKMPSENSSYLEKCRTITPIIDNILKQYNYYVEDQKIDQELLQMSSTHLFFNSCKSLNKNKYLYLLSEDLKLAAHLLYSNQSLVRNIYDSKNLVHLLNFYDIKLNMFEDYQLSNIKWLIDYGIIFENENKYIKISNFYKLEIIRELYYEEVISYWNCSNKIREELDILIRNKELEIEDKLFTRLEEDYLNYHLNKTKFCNSLDLRNRYSHGTNTCDEKQHKIDYFIFLKIIIIIIIKINDDLCINFLNKK